MTVATIHTHLLSKIIISGYFHLLLVHRWAWEWWELGLTEGCGGDGRNRWCSVMEIYLVEIRTR
jgi:hypothetical protein